MAADGLSRTAPASTPRSRPRVRRLVRVGAVLALVVLGGLLAVGWYYTDQVLLVEEPGPPIYDTEVVSVTADTVVLADRGGAAQPGTWGLAWDDGFAQVGDIIDRDAGLVTRPWRPLPDRPVPGVEALLDGYAFPDDPVHLDAGVVEVAVDGPLGTYPAWHAPGSASTWVVAVHGRGARRSEPFRLMDALRGTDVPVLALTYRNDAGAPRAPDGRYRLGATEWEDVVAGVRWAQGQGAEEIVLVGYSMGGAIVGAYLDDAPQDLPPVVGVVLDAPVVRWGPVLRLAAADRGVPGWLVGPAQVVTTMRTGLSWSSLDWLRRADGLDVPVLVFHTTGDGVVPVSTSDDLAAARPDLVTYVRTVGDGHVASWNLDPAAYAAEVQVLLDRVAR